jgi:hypothetical protein
VINDHSGMLGARSAASSRRRRAHGARAARRRAGRVYEQDRAVAPDVGLISISMNQRKPKPDLNWIANCPNALDFSVYPCKPHRGDYLLFLGR